MPHATVLPRPVIERRGLIIILAAASIVCAVSALATRRAGEGVWVLRGDDA